MLIKEKVLEFKIPSFHTASNNVNDTEVLSCFDINVSQIIMFG